MPTITIRRTPFGAQNVGVATLSAHRTFAVKKRTALVRVLVAASASCCEVWPTSAKFASAKFAATNLIQTESVAGPAVLAAPVTQARPRYAAASATASAIVRAAAHISQTSADSTQTQTHGARPTHPM